MTTATVEQYQTHRPIPQTYDEWEELLAAGVLITTGGRVLVRRPCPRCGDRLLGSTDGMETCTCEVECPTCEDGKIGRRCKRPSEHDVPGGSHDSRRAAAMRETERRAAGGDPDVPARWYPAERHTAPTADLETLF